jgi:hypothetical protein
MSAVLSSGCWYSRYRSTVHSTCCWQRTRQA